MCVRAGGTYGKVELREKHATKLTRLSSSSTGLFIGSNVAEVAMLGYIGGMEGVVRVFDMTAAGEEELQIVMERGVSMHEWLAGLGVRQRSMNAMRIFRGLLAAVVGLHRLGIAHLDIKPANVVLWFEGEMVVRVALIDFGASRLVASWCPRGSPQYVLCTREFAAPETFTRAGARPTFACDAFSVGAVMHEVVFGRPFANFRGMKKERIVQWWAQWLEDRRVLGLQAAWEFAPAGGQFSEKLCNAVQRLLKEDPAQRVSLERLYAEFVPEGELLQPAPPSRVRDPPFCADEPARRAGLAFLSTVCQSPVSFPLAANIYALYRRGVWPQQPSEGEARVLRGCACLAQLVKFPDSHVSDEHAGEVATLVRAFGSRGCMSDTVERVLWMCYGVQVPDHDLLWRAVAGAQRAHEQAGLYMELRCGTF